VLVRLVRRGAQLVADRFLRASDIDGALGQANNAEWKTLAIDERSGRIVVPQGSIGFRWNQKPGEDQGRWNLEQRDATSDEDVSLQLSLADHCDDVVGVAFPYFGGLAHEHFAHNDQGSDVLIRNVPVRRLQLADGEALVTTVFDLLVANYGLHRGLGADGSARSYDEDLPYTPRWQESITGVPAGQVITIARQFAENAEKTRGKSMVIIGAAMNHWYHSDMNYRGIINMLMLYAAASVSPAAAGHTTSARRSSGRRRAGRPLPSRSTGTVPPGSRTRHPSSTPTPTSGDTRSSRSAKSFRRSPTRPG